VAVQALCVDPHVPVARVLCLGSPLCGSGAAAGLARLPLSRLYFGHSAELLLNGCMTWPDRFEVGMIAGSSPHGMGQWFGRFQGEHDGRSEEHTSELQSRENLVCRLLLEKKKTYKCTIRD